MSEFKRIQIQIKKKLLCVCEGGKVLGLVNLFLIKNVNIQNFFVVVVVVFIVE